MPENSNQMLIGPILLAMPKNCVPEVRLVFRAANEEFSISSYLETRDGGPREIAANRLATARVVAGGSLKVLREESGEVEGHVSRLTVVQVRESWRQVSTLGQMLIQLGPRRFVDLQSQFRKHWLWNRHEDFERIAGTLRLSDSTAQSASSASTPAGWKTWRLPGMTIDLPARLKRATAYRFSDLSNRMDWSADAWVLEVDSESSANTIPPEVTSPMLTRTREESFRSGDVTGTITVFSRINTAMGTVGDRIVRGEVVVGQRIKVIVRGRSPDSKGDELEADLKFILQNLKPA